MGWSWVRVVRCCQFSDFPSRPECVPHKQACHWKFASLPRSTRTAFNAHGRSEVGPYLGAVGCVFLEGVTMLHIDLALG